MINCLDPHARSCPSERIEKDKSSRMILRSALRVFGGSWLTAYNGLPMFAVQKPSAPDANASNVWTSVDTQCGSVFLCDIHEQKPCEDGVKFEGSVARGATKWGLDEDVSAWKM